MHESPAEQASTLQKMIQDREATVGVIGLGYVGLPLALLFAESGFNVIGFDTDRAKVDALRAGDSYVRHIGKERVRAVFQDARHRVASQFDLLTECDVIIICVPTPLGKHRDPDLTYVRMTADEIARRLRKGQLVVLESTTYPGTTREEVVPRLASSGLDCGTDFFVAFSPEREDPGNERFSTRTIPKIVGGVDAVSRDLAVQVYSAAVDEVIPVSSAEIAESSKLLENIFRAVNIALVNEMKIVLDRMGIDIWEVIDAAKTKPFGFMAFYPGPGLGGHCIPLDPFYLTWKAAEYGVWARFIELAGEINTSMPHYVVDKVGLALNAKGMSVFGASILVLGLSYKANIDDDRESPSFEIIELLQDRGAAVSYCDPYIPVARRGRKHDLAMSSVPCTPEEFSRYDVLVLSTAHRDFSDMDLYREVKLVVDTRNVVPPAMFPGRVVKA